MLLNYTFQTSLFQGRVAMNKTELNVMDVGSTLAESMRVKDLELLQTVIEDNETPLQSMSELLAKLCGMPISGVSLVDSNTVWIKAHHGIEAESLPRQGAFCGAAIDAHDDLFVVENASEDPRFCHNPLVSQAPSIRFYAAYAFQGGRGFPVGTLWMMDTQPHRMDEEKQAILKCLGAYLDQSIQNMYRCPVTGLPNRKSFLRRTQALLNESQQKVSTAFIHVHRMRHLASAYGLDFRDAVIRHISSRLSQWCKGGVLAHFGAGNFAYAWAGSYQKADLRQILHAIEAPVTEGGVTISVNVSVGIASAEPDFACAAALTELAELAASEKQRLGLSNIHYQDGVANHRLSKDLQACLHADSAENHFAPYYQPQVDMATGGIFGFEALLRWHNPEHSDTPVWQVLTQIEAMGKTPALDLLMFEKVCRDLSHWQRQGMALPKMSVNISRTTLQTESLDVKLFELATRYGLKTADFTLEITESGVPLDDSVLSQRIERLQEIGFHIAVDDFGTGMSNIGTLKTIACNLLKVDRQFVHGVAGNPHIAALLRLIKGTADSMGVALLVEGVESQDDLDWLLSSGIYLIQGWYFAKALEGRHIEALLRQAPTPVASQSMQARAEGLRCFLKKWQS